MKKISNYNKKSDIILSVSALAYNNSEEVRRLLLSVLPQMQSGAEIVINDNSTNDEIEIMVKKEFNSPFVRYFKNKENVGAERNLILAAERSLGKYVWWYGNDEMCDGAIAHVLDILKKEPDISFVFVNFHIVDQGLDKPIIKISKDKLFKDKNQVLEELANVLSFISSIIVKKNNFDNINRDEMNRFIGSEFINFFIVLHVLAQDGKAYFIAFPYVRCYPTPSGTASFDGFTVFAINFFKVAKNFEKYFSKKSLKKLLAKNFGHVWRGMLVGNIKEGSISIKHLLILFKFYWNFPEFWVALPFFLTPRFINIFFYKLFKKITGNNKYLKQKLTKVPWF